MEQQEQEELTIGWQVVDQYGNIVASGPVTVAEMTAEVGQLLDLAKKESEQWQA